MCNSNFVKFAKNGASYNISPLVKNVQWCDVYSNFFEKNENFGFYLFSTFSHRPTVGGPAGRLLGGGNHSKGPSIADQHLALDIFPIRKLVSEVLKMGQIKQRKQ